MRATCCSTLLFPARQSASEWRLYRAVSGFVAGGVRDWAVHALPVLGPGLGMRVRARNSNKPTLRRTSNENGTAAALKEGISEARGRREVPGPCFRRPVRRRQRTNGDLSRPCWPWRVRSCGRWRMGGGLSQDGPWGHYGGLCRPSSRHLNQVWLRAGCR